MLFCIGAQYDICTNEPYVCSQDFTYDSNSRFTLHASIVLIKSGMNCCNVSDPVWTVITIPGDSGQQVVDSGILDPPGIDICTGTSADFITNIATVRIKHANTTFQIMHSFYTGIVGEHRQHRSVTFNFYFVKGEEHCITRFFICNYFIIAFFASDVDFVKIIKL